MKDTPITYAVRVSDAAVSERTRPWACGVAVAVLALLTAVAAQIKLPLPDTPVPVTLQTAVVLWAGLSLGPWLGSAAMGLYLLLGMAGTPVFAEAVWKEGVFFGHTGGYLIGFLLAQPAVGLAARARIGRSTWPGIALGAIAGNIIIFAAGVIWLSAWLRVDLPRALELGLYPFALGMILKSALAAVLGGATRPAADRILGRHHSR